MGDPRPQLDAEQFRDGSADEIASEICGREVPWEWSQDQRPRQFPSHHLLPEFRLWHHFIVTRLSPTSHYSHVSYDRANLLYRIARRATIHVGLHISEAINRVARMKKTRLVFPHLITEMILAAGVEYESTQDVLQPLPCLDKAMFAALGRGVDVGGAGSEGEEEDTAGQPAAADPWTQHDTLFDAPPTTVRQLAAGMERQNERMTALRQDVYRLDQRVDRLDQRVERDSIERRELAALQFASNSAVVEHLRWIAQHQQMDMSQFPPMPHIPAQYHPSQYSWYRPQPSEAPPPFYHFPQQPPPGDGSGPSGGQ